MPLERFHSIPAAVSNRLGDLWEIPQALCLLKVRSGLVILTYGLQAVTTVEVVSAIRRLPFDRFGEVFRSLLVFFVVEQATPTLMVEVLSLGKILDRQSHVGGSFSKLPGV